MKTITRIFSITLLLSLALPAIQAQPTIWTVNPDPAAGADFDDLQQAIDHALEGDILYVAGNNDRHHSFAYWNISIDKRLTLYGTGYWLAENRTSVSEPTIPSIILNLNIEQDAAGTLISGFTLERVQVSDIEGSVTFKGNIFSQGPIDIGYTTRVHFAQNYFNEMVYFDFRETPFVTFSNNLILCQQLNLADAQIQSLAFTHNIIHSNLHLRNVWGALYFGYNIFLESYHLELESEFIERIVSKYNLFDAQTTNVYEGDYPFDSTDLRNVDLNDLFGIHNHFEFRIWLDRAFVVPVDSPARDVDQQGTLAGPFGGSDPYRLSGLPNIPRIEVLEAPNFATTSEGIPIRIKINSEPVVNQAD